MDTVTVVLEVKQRTHCDGSLEFVDAVTGESLFKSSNFIAVLVWLRDNNVCVVGCVA
jgi:hypothetical protein